jgi:glutaredoxin
MMASKRATVFSTTYCPYCTKAKKLLDTNEVEYNEVMLDEINGNSAEELSNCIYEN